jgi:Domain of unknown function (DUF4400)
VIRAVCIIGLVLVLGIATYVPTVLSPDRFIAIVQAEHEANVDAWGPDAANRVLARALDWSPDRRPHETFAPVDARQIDQAMLRKVSEIAERFTSNRYFQSVDALLVLAAYRASVAIELMPLLAVFVVAVFIDALVVRSVRTKELIAPSGEAFGASLLLAVALACTAIVGMFVPLVIGSIAMAACLLAALLFLGRALANYPSLRH